MRLACRNCYNGNDMFYESLLNRRAATQDKYGKKKIAECLELASKIIFGRVDRMERGSKLKKRVYRLETLKIPELEPDLPSDKFSSS